MSDKFQQGLGATIPALEQLLDGLTTVPTASSELLQRLREMTPAERPAEVQKRRETTPTLPPQSTPKGPPSSPPLAPAARPVTSPSPAPVGDPSEWTLETMREAALACMKCPPLAESRTQVVFGVGNPKAELMFVGEAPGADEDVQGEPFVGRAGQLLTKIIQAMGYTRDDVYIANVLKCRPDMPKGAPGNRKPTREEMNTCLPWLERQIELIQPKVMVALGATALEGLLGETRSVSGLRGKWLEFRGIPVMATYHPAYLLRNQSISEKRKVWEDMLKVLERLERPITEKQRKFFTKSEG